MKLLIAPIATLVVACGSAPPPAAPLAPAPNTVSGTIAFSDPKGLVADTVIFVIARPRAGGTPVAVDKIYYRGAATTAFELDASKAFPSGGKLEGDLTVTARYDLDGDAVTKNPGDRSGSVDVTVPASGVVLVIDHVIQ